MEKIEIERLINLGFSQRKMGEELNCSQSNVKYYLKKYNLKTVNVINYEHIKVNEDEKYCSSCDTVKLKTDYYKRSKKCNTLQSTCKDCQNKKCADRVKNVKIKMINHKGGKCEDCKLHLDDTHYCIFDFHHLDPNEKDSNFDRIKYQSWEKIEEELNKCVLLCANCHRLRHAKLGEW